MPQVIWSRYSDVPREIIGETRLSWIIKPDAEWMESVKLPKKDINRGHGRPQWFWEKEERDAEIWADTNFNKIKRAMGEYTRTVDRKTLRAIADLLGFKE